MPAKGVELQMVETDPLAEAPEIEDHRPRWSDVVGPTGIEPVTERL